MNRSLFHVTDWDFINLPVHVTSAANQALHCTEMFEPMFVQLCFFYFQKENTAVF